MKDQGTALYVIGAMVILLNEDIPGVTIQWQADEHPGAWHLFVRLDQGEIGDCLVSDYLKCEDFAGLDDEHAARWAARRVLAIVCEMRTLRVEA